MTDQLLWHTNVVTHCWLHNDSHIDMFRRKCEFQLSFFLTVFLSRSFECELISTVLCHCALRLQGIVDLIPLSSYFDVCVCGFPPRRDTSEGTHTT